MKTENPTMVILDADTNEVQPCQMRIGLFYRVEKAPMTEVVGCLACRIDVGLVCLWYDLGKDGKDCPTFATLPIEEVADCVLVKTKSFAFSFRA